MFIDVYFAWKLVIKRKGWSLSLALCAAVKTDACFTHAPSAVRTPLEILRSKNVLRTSLLVSRTLPSNVPRTFWDGHDVEFFKGLGDVIWRTFPEHSGRSRDVYGTIFYLKIDVPKTSSERPCWCQGRCLVTSPERSETVTMSSSLKGWGTLFGGPSQDIQDVLGTFMGLYFIWKLTFPKRPCWCQGRCLVTSPERSETVTMWVL